MKSIDHASEGFSSILVFLYLIYNPHIEKTNNVHIEKENDRIYSYLFEIEVEFQGR